ncbi:MAG: LamG-like jellyroll fold domain-containing protein, partial [Pirellulales bacterium]
AAGLWWQRTETAPSPYRGAQVAVLSKTVGAQFVYGPNGEHSPGEGVGLRQGVYELASGLIEIEYDSGALLVVQAPATFELVDDSSVRLDDGQVSAHVPQAAIGFRIDSPGATVIDMGTDFAVQAVRDQESEVHVFQGEVLVDLHGDKGKSSDPLRLVTGEATRVDYLTGMPSGIDLDAQQFLRTLREAESKYAEAVIKLDPSVYYRMEPVGDGSQLVDSASGANATVNFGKARSPVWTAGKFGAAFELGGTAMQTYAAAPSYPQAQGDEISVVGWVYARSRPRWASIAKNWAGGDYDRGQFHFGLNHDSGELEAHIVDSSGQEIAVRDSEPLPLKSWHHVAFVADGQTLRLYRNGREVDAKPYHRLHRDPRITALAIGTKLNLNGNAPEERDYNMWDGRLDELAIFNHSLSAEEVKSLYDLASGGE